MTETGSSDRSRRAEAGPPAGVRTAKPGYGPGTLLIALAVLTLLHAVALSSSRLLPFTDLPNHLAAATIVRHHGEFGNEFSRYFDVDLFPKPNVLHLVWSSMAVFPSAEAATRAWYFLYALLLPLSTLLLIRSLGGAAWAALLSLLVMYSYSVSWGFTPYTMAIPLVVLSAWASAGMAMRGGLRYTVMSVFLLLLLFFTHALAAQFAMLVHVIFMLSARERRAASRIAGCLTILPAAAMLLAWWLFGRSFWFGPSTTGHIKDYYSNVYLPSLPAKWKLLYIDNYSTLGGTAGVIFGVAVSAVIVAAALIPALYRRGRAGSGAAAAGAPGGRAAAPGGRADAPGGRRYALILLALSLACFLFLPKDLPGQAILAQRFSVFVFLSLAVLAGVMWKGRRAALVSTAVAAACLVHLIVWWSGFRAFNRENEGFTPDFLPEPWKGRVLAGLIYDYTWRGRPAYIHFPGYYITWKKGIATTSLIGYRFGAVRRRAPLAVLPAYLEWTGRSGRYDGRYAELDYILMRGALPRGREYEIEGFAPMRSAGKWHLLKKD
jgi:hypothetical protein